MKYISIQKSNNAALCLKASIKSLKRKEKRFNKVLTSCVQHNSYLTFGFSFQKYMRRYINSLLLYWVLLYKSKNF